MEKYELIDKMFDLSESIYDIFDEEFANCLKQLREHTKLSIVELGKLTNIPFQHISKYEKGETEPSVSRAVKILNVFFLDTDDIVECSLIDEDITEKFDERYRQVYEYTPERREWLKKVFPRFTLEA